MDINSTIQLDPSLLYNKVGEEIVLLTVESGKYFRVDPIGSKIWEMIKEPCTIETVCNNLLEEYEVSREQCLEEIGLFIERLRADKLLVA